MKVKQVLLLSAFLASFPLAAWCSPPPFEARDGVELFVEPLLLKGLGGSSYDLSFDAGGGTTGLSRLEFPRLSLEAGATLGVAINRGTRREWLFQAEVAHSTLAMAGTMNDYDWMQPAGFPKIPFSYTYSDDTTVSWRAGAEIARTLFSGDRWALGGTSPTSTRHRATWRTPPRGGSTRGTPPPAHMTST